MKNCNKNTPTLETERLILRKFTNRDIGALFEILQDEEVNTYLPWFPAKTLEDAERFFKTHYECVYEQPRGYAYAVCLKTDDKPIGYIKIETDDSYDFGYGLKKEFWGRGIMTEAGSILLKQAKADGIPYVTATHDRKNFRSGAVMKRLGMTYRYSYEEQWQPKNFPVIFRMYQLNLNGKRDETYKKYWENASVRFIETNI